MKKIYNFIITRPIITLLAIIIVIFLPPAVAAEPQGFGKLIVQLISIDKTGDEYEVSFMAYIPKPADAFSENLHILSAKGRTPDLALVNISKLTGKTIGLAHSRIIFVNEELCEYGLIPSLDYLVREYSLGNNTYVFNTGKSPAKDVLSASREMTKNLGISIADVADYDKSTIFATEICVEELYAESFSHNKVLLLGVIELKEDSGIDVSVEGADENSLSGDESSSNEEGGGPSQGAKKLLANEGNAIVLREGKKVLELDYSELFSLNWARTRKDFGLLELANYSDNIFTNANISLFVYQNKAEIKTKFEDGKPICEVFIAPRLMLDEVEQAEINKEFYNKTYHLTEHNELIKNINKKIELDFSRVLKRMIKNNIDILDFYEIFYVNNTRQFKNFLDTLEDRDSYISKMEIRIKSDATILE